MCSGSIVVPLQLLGYIVFLLGRRIAEGIILMSTFEELILIDFFFVISENEVNSFIVTFLLLVNFTFQDVCVLHF